MNRRVVFVTAVAAVLVASAVRASAVSSAQSGWWTSAPVAAAPDVPAGGLLLQGGPTLDRPVAFGAVSFTLGADEHPGDLTLVVAANGGTTPNASLTVCPLTNSFTAAQGGPMRDAPAFDCTSKATATRSADGHTYLVHAGSLARNGSVALALLPTAATDRIVLDQPHETALATSRSTSTNAATMPTPRDEAAAVETISAPSPASTGVPAVGATKPPASTAPPASPSPAASQVATAPARVDVRPAARHHAPTPVIAFVALVVLASALWLFAGNTPAASTSIGGPQT